jgi:hypothetical protein
VPAGNAAAALSTFSHDYIEVSYTGGTNASAASGLSSTGTGMYVDTESVSSGGYGFMFSQKLAATDLNASGQETVNVLLTNYQVGDAGYLTVTLANGTTATATASNTGAGTAITGTMTNVYKNHYYGLLSLLVQGSSGETLSIQYTNGTAAHTVGVLSANVTATPEPATLALFGVAGAGLLFLRRRTPPAVRRMDCSTAR